MADSLGIPPEAWEKAVEATAPHIAILRGAPPEHALDDDRPADRETYRRLTEPVVEAALRSLLESGAVVEHEKYKKLAEYVDEAAGPVSVLIPVAQLEEVGAKAARVWTAERQLAECKTALTEALEYVEHTSWRCGHPDRYPYDPDCSCGLVEAEKRWSATLARLQQEERDG